MHSRLAAAEDESERRAGLMAGLELTVEVCLFHIFEIWWSPSDYYSGLNFDGQTVRT
eukprot:SAG11_NODE_30950_length_296_cov_0.741117_1_plen_56_part_01